MIRSFISTLMGVALLINVMVAVPVGAAGTPTFQRDSARCQEAGTLTLSGLEASTIVDAVISWQYNGFGVSSEHYGTGGTGVWKHYFDVGAERKLFPKGMFDMNVRVELESGDVIINERINVVACSNEEPKEVCTTVRITAVTRDFPTTWLVVDGKVLKKVPATPTGQSNTFMACGQEGDRWWLASGRGHGPEWRAGYFY